MNSKTASLWHRAFHLSKTETVPGKDPALLCCSGGVCGQKGQKGRPKLAFEFALRGGKWEDWYSSYKIVLTLCMLLAQGRHQGWGCNHASSVQPSRLHFTGKPAGKRWYHWWVWLQALSPAFFWKQACYSSTYEFSIWALWKLAMALWPVSKVEFRLWEFL